MRDFIVAALEQRKSLAEDPEAYEAILAQFRVAGQFDRALNGGPEELVQLLQKELSCLKQGGPFFLSSRMDESRSGHAIVLEFLRQQNHLFSLRIYNSGQGLEYHENAVFENQEYHSRFSEIQDISAERIASFPFCKALCMMGKEAPYGEWRGVEVYEALRPHLEGKPVSQEPILENMSKTVSVGFCTYLSLAHWMQEFAPTLFDRFQIELQTKAFADFARSADRQLESHRNLIQKAGEQLARNGQAAFDQGMIAQKDLVHIQKAIGLAIVEAPKAAMVHSLQTEIFQSNIKTFSKPQNLFTNGVTRRGNPRIFRLFGGYPL